MAEIYWNLKGEFTTNENLKLISKLGCIQMSTSFLMLISLIISLLVPYYSYLLSHKTQMFLCFLLSVIGAFQSGSISSYLIDVKINRKNYYSSRVERKKQEIEINPKKYLNIYQITDPHLGNNFIFFYFFFIFLYFLIILFFEY